MVPVLQRPAGAFQRHAEKLERLNVKVVSLSVDDQDTARELIAKHGLTFPVGHSADAAAIHEATGAFVNADPVHLQSTGFVARPRRQRGHQRLLKRRDRPPGA